MSLPGVGNPSSAFRESRDIENALMQVRGWLELGAMALAALRTRRPEPLSVTEQVGEFTLSHRRPVAFREENKMIQRTTEDYIIDSIGMAWPTVPIPSLQIYSYSINHQEKQVILKAFLDNEIFGEIKDDVWDIELEISTQLPDDWSVNTLFINSKSTDSINENDIVAFRRGDSVTPKDRLALRMEKRLKSQPRWLF